MKNGKKWFYVGINPCGCITASMTTCREYATPKKVDDFKRKMDLTGRTTELREFSKDEFMAAFGECRHKSNAELRGASVTAQPACEASLSNDVLGARGSEA